MKRIKKRLTWVLPPSRLYRDDIEAIHELIANNIDTSVSSVKELIEIEIDSFSLQGIDEMESLIKQEVLKTNKVKILAIGKLTLHLSEDTAYLDIVDSEDMLLLGLAHKIKEIVQKRAVVPGIPGFKSVWQQTGIFIVVQFSILMLSAFISEKNKVISNLMINITWVFNALFLVIHFTHNALLRKQYSTIHLVAYRERSSFWKRNKEFILANLAWNILIAIITMIGTYFITITTKNCK